ncbi:MAG: glycosyltransferase, partial [Nitrospirota bacterium]
AYSGALALVYPSRYEGFGLPVLEAMKSGCPVITCRNSSLPEVAGDAALYVDEVDVAEMRDALIKIQRPDVRSELVRKGFENVKRFSWKDTGQKLVSAIQEILKDIKDIPLNPSDPLDTPGRLIYTISKCPGWKQIYPAMVNLEAAYMESRAYNQYQIEKDESVVAGMDSEIFNLLLGSLPLIEQKNQFIYYYYGLALEKRKMLPEALEAYKTAIACWQTAYVWRPAYLAADLAQRLGELELAKQLLTDIVLRAYPAYAEAQNKLRIVNDALKSKSIDSAQQKASEYVRFTPPGESKQADEKKDFKVSAIVSTYNSEKFIRGCLEDLTNQTLFKKDELEIIVVDSGSEQNEKAIVEEFRNKYRAIKYIRTENRETVYAAWNRGIKAAGGKYITNANTDDRHRRDALEVMADALDQNPGNGLVYADAIITERENETFERHTPAGSYSWLDYGRELLAIGCFVGPQPMWRKSLHDEYGYFDDAFTVAGDWEFWLRIAAGSEFLHISDFLGLYFYSPGGMEHRNPDITGEEQKRIYLEYLPKYLATIEDVERGLSALEQLEQKTSRPQPEFRQHLLQWKSVLLSKKPATADKAEYREAVLEFAGAGTGSLSRKKRTSGLTSVIVITSDQFSRTKKCIKSIRKNTPELHEVIALADGSSPKAMEWLRKQANEDRDFKLIAMEKEPGGYAQACNKGIGESSGQYIAVLTDDVVVSKEWLGGMLECLNVSPHAGVVGPMTTNAGGRQNVTAGYGSLENLDRFAAAYREKYRYRRLPSRKISGCCMVFRHDLADNVGLFDERFAVQDAAADDFCWRAAMEGYGIVIAGDVFLYRHGEEDTSAQKRDEAARAARDLFTGKWSQVDSATQKKILTLNAINTAGELSQMGRVESAVQTLIEAGGLNADDNRVHYSLAAILLENKKFSEAWGIIESMAAGLKQDIRWLELAARCMAGMKQYREAREYADRILAMNAASSAALNIKGLAAGNGEEAEKLFQKALQADRGFAEAYANIGRIKQLSRGEEAYRFFEKAFILSPAHQDIAKNYYSSALSLSRLQQAEELFREAVVLYPVNRMLRFMLADILIQMKKSDEAGKIMEEALAISGEDDHTRSLGLQVRGKRQDGS